jgi:hypothetical protein
VLSKEEVCKLLANPPPLVLEQSLENLTKVIDLMLVFSLFQQSMCGISWEGSTANRCDVCIFDKLKAPPKTRQERWKDSAEGTWLWKPWFMASSMIYRFKRR